MFKRAAQVLLVVLLVATGCGKIIGPKAGERVIGEDTAEAKQLQLALAQDPSLQQLQKAGYTPVAVITNGDFRIVTYHQCGKMPAQECSNSRPDASHPVVALFTNESGLDDPITFSGEFRLIYAAPTNLQPMAGIEPDAYKLYCRVRSSPSRASTALAGYIDQFAEIGNYFAPLEYSAQKKTMTHTLPNNDGSSWECTARTKL